MVTNDSIKIEKVTPGQAKTWLDFCKYDNQRKLRQYWVDFLADQMTKGKFESSATQIQFCFCVEDSNTYLVNGQHTLNAIVQSGVILDGLVITRTITNTKKEVDEFYTVIDKQSKRTIVDAFRALDVENVWGITRECARHISSAAVLIETEFIDNHSRSLHNAKNSRRRQFSDSEIVYLGNQWIEDYKKFNEAITPCDNDIRVKLHQTNVLALVLITFRCKPIEAKEFWRQVAQDDGLKVGDPRKTLNKWLMNHGSRARKANIEVVHPEAFPRVVAKCWSKWMKGEEVKNIAIDYGLKIEDSLFGIPKEEITKYYNNMIQKNNL